MFKVLDILFPRFCLGCGREGSYICKDCEIFLSEVDVRDIRDSSVFSVWEHEGLMERLIYKIKFSGKYHIMDELVEKAFAKIELNLPSDIVITYVPMFKKRQRERGFNQAEYIARKLGNMFFPMKQVTPLLEKIKDNQAQPGLGAKASEDNVRNVFKYCSSFLPQNVLLVDDVCATGATVKECVKVLKNKGIRNVWVFTLSRKTSI
jgi:competence protein ComFC